MDGVSAGASILALAATAVQTSRTIYNVVSTVKSGSKEVQCLVSGARNLERILGQMSSIFGSQSTSYLACHLDGLDQSVRECAADLDSICEQLWKLWYDNGHDTRLGPAKKAWRLVKVAIKKDDVQRMSRVMQHHMSMLTLHIVMLNRWVGTL
jgi:hypothetical protein